METLAFELREPPRTTAIRGRTASAPLSVDAVAEIEVLGGLFRGAIRGLCFHADGSLLVLAGLGVRRLDPDTLEERDLWLPTRHVQSVHACGERLWIVTGDEVFLAPFGAELGRPLTSVEHNFTHDYAAVGSKLALVRKGGARVVDAETCEVRDFDVDEAWFAGLWMKADPRRAMLSPCGRTLGVCNDRYTVIWDLETGEERLAKEHVESMALLDDRRVFKGEEHSSWVTDVLTEERSRAPGSAHFDGGDAIVRGERLLAADSNGGFALLDGGSFELLAELDAHDKDFGRVASGVRAALSERHVATYAAMAGILRVTAIGGETVESRDWSGGAEGLSVGRGGRRAAVFREWSEGRLDEGTLLEVRGPSGDGITTAGITPDGASLVVPCGSILRARRVHVGAFGAAECEDIHAIKCCAHEFVGYGDDRYAISTYTLQGAGHVGLHRAGAKRALAKVVYQKEQPWRIAVGAGEDELLIAWQSATVLYDMVKRPKPVEVFTLRAGAVALGPRGYLALAEGREQLLIRTPGREPVRVKLSPRRNHGLDRLAFSRGGDLLMVGSADGVLELRRSIDGELLREVPLHVGAFVALQRCGEAMWSMGEDGVVHILGLR